MKFILKRKKETEKRFETSQSMAISAVFYSAGNLLELLKILKVKSDQLCHFATQVMQKGKKNVLKLLFLGKHYINKLTHFIQNN